MGSDSAALLERATSAMVAEGTGLLPSGRRGVWGAAEARPGAGPPDRVIS